MTLPYPVKELVDFLRKKHNFSYIYIQSRVGQLKWGGPSFHFTRNQLCDFGEVKEVAGEGESL